MFRGVFAPPLLTGTMWSNSSRSRDAAIEPSTVKCFLVHLAEEGYAAGTIRNALAPVRATLADAAEDGIIRSNPAAGVRIPPTAKQPDTKRAKALTPEQLTRLRDALETDDDRLLVDFLVATGLRVSELMALEWRHVEIGQRRVRVEQRLYRGLDMPKSLSSRRVVRVSPAMTRRLRALWMAHGRPSPETPVFVSTEGCRLEYSNLRKRIVPAMRAAGIERGAFHLLRHTIGTELKRRGPTSSRSRRISVTTISCSQSGCTSTSTATKRDRIRRFSTTWRAARLPPFD